MRKLGIFFDRVTECRLQKHEMNWASWVMKLSRESLEAFYKGFFMGDGTQGQKLISQNEGNVFDAVVAVTQLLGKVGFLLAVTANADTSVWVGVTT